MLLKLKNNVMKFINSSFKISLVIINALTLSACAPKTYVTLLNNADGSVGEVSVKGEKGEVVLKDANTGSLLDGSSKEAFTVDATQLQNDFGGALKAQPPLPESFLLYFESGGTNLTTESAALIPTISERILARKEADMSIIGHSDTSGAAKLNEQLARERAVYVSGFFNAAELHLTEITITSHGEKNLLVKTADNVKEPRNRRVEVTIR